MTKNVHNNNTEYKLNGVFFYKINQKESYIYYKAHILYNYLLKHNLWKKMTLNKKSLKVIITRDIIIYN